MLRSIIRVTEFDDRTNDMIKIFFGYQASILRGDAGVDIIISGEEGYQFNYKIMSCVNFLQEHGVKVIRTTCQENKNFYRYNRDRNNYIEGSTISIRNLTFMASNKLNHLFHKGIIADISADVPSSITNEYTKGMIWMMYDYITPATNVIDIGCGKGLVCMASVALKAKKTTGIDVVPYHIKVAQQSAYKFNKISKEKLEFIWADILKDYHSIKDKYDVITCNLNAPIIQNLMKTDILNNLLNKNGTIILGGFTVFSEESIVRTIEDNQKINGLEIEDVNVFEEYGDICYITLKRRYQL